MKPIIRRIWFYTRLPLQITGACSAVTLFVALFLYGLFSFIHWMAN